MTNQKPTFEISIDTRAVYDLLMAAKIGDTVTYSTMSKALGRSHESAMANILSAVRHVLAIDGRVFANVRRIGYRRLSDVEIVNTGEAARESMRRKARRAGKVITAVADFAALPNDSKIKHNTYLSVFGAIAAITKPSGVKKIEAEVVKTQATLPLGRTLEAFKT